MIKRLYFWDGSLNYCPLISCPKDIFIKHIDAGFGYSENHEKIENYKNNKESLAVVINNLALLSFDYGWDDEENKSITFLWDSETNSWRNIIEFTDKELRKAHNIEHIYRAGGFNKN